jgi:hypothetical protein
MQALKYCPSLQDIKIIIITNLPKSGIKLSGCSLEFTCQSNRFRNNFNALQ